MKPVKNRSVTVKKIQELREKYMETQAPAMEHSPERTPLHYYRYQCGICGQKTMRQATMRWHLNKTHNIILKGDLLC